MPCSVPAVCGCTCSCVPAERVSAPARLPSHTHPGPIRVMVFPSAMSTGRAGAVRGSRRAGQGPGRRGAPGSGHGAPGATGPLQQPRDRAPCPPLPAWPAGTAPVGDPASLQRPPAPRSLPPGVGRGLCVLCVAERRGRGASPAAPCLQSRARRKAPYQDKSPRRRRGRSRQSGPGAVGGAGSADGCVYRAGGLAKRLNPSRPLRGCAARPPGCPWAPALLALPAGRGQKFPRSSGAGKPQPFLGSSVPRPGTAKQGPTQSSPNTSRAGSKGHLRLGSCGRSESHARIPATSGLCGPEMISLGCSVHLSYWEDKAGIQSVQE